MINLCVPTLNRYDLLYDCLYSALNGSLVPFKIYIIDNGQKLPQNIRDLVGGKLALYTPSTNLGVAKSWNWFLQVVPNPMLIVNDDLVFSTDDIKNFYDSYAYFNNESSVGLFHSANISPLNMFSCFMLTPECVTKVGLFDEEFYPAYFEDNDYYRRLKLAGFSTHAVTTNIQHFGSATIKNYDAETMTKHHETFNRNKQRYLTKWGGLPHEESFVTPFGK